MDILLGRVWSKNEWEYIDLKGMVISDGDYNICVFVVDVKDDHFILRTDNKYTSLCGCIPEPHEIIYEYKIEKEKETHRYKLTVVTLGPYQHKIGGCELNGWKDYESFHPIKEVYYSDE